MSKVILWPPGVANTVHQWFVTHPQGTLAEFETRFAPSMPWYRPGMVWATYRRDLSYSGTTWSRCGLVDAEVVPILDLLARHNASIQLGEVYGKHSEETCSMSALCRGGGGYTADKDEIGCPGACAWSEAAEAPRLSVRI